MTTRGGDQYRSGLHAEKTGPQEFFSGGSDMQQTYDMIDGVSDEQFDAALTEANLSTAPR